ncbi:MAG TPA: hypothetical protein VI522_02300 [Gammaproteobacteria bacterium]|nr:hypothetical protein [Gammaproteobacteria bacterium]
MTTAQALDESIAHWQRMLKLTIEDIRNNKEYPSARNCALCSLYICNFNCNGCPVNHKTGLDGCKGTPYQEATDLYEAIYKGTPHAIKTFHKAVQKEVQFLESLR